MNLRKALRRYWPETLLVLAVAFPWLSLLALGGIWLWFYFGQLASRPLLPLGDRDLEKAIAPAEGHH